MKRAEIEITTECVGKREISRFFGTVEKKEDGFLVKYICEGDSVDFFFGETAYMRRQGGSNLFFQFINGETSVAEIGFGGSCGSFPLSTWQYRFRAEENSALIYIKYTLGLSGGDRDMKVWFRVKFAANPA